MQQCIQAYTNPDWTARSCQKVSEYYTACRAVTTVLLWNIITIPSCPTAAVFTAACVNIYEHSSNKRFHEWNKSKLSTLFCLMVPPSALFIFLGLWLKNLQEKRNTLKVIDDIIWHNKVFLMDVYPSKWKEILTKIRLFYAVASRTTKMLHFTGHTWIWPFPGLLPPNLPQ